MDCCGRALMMRRRMPSTWRSRNWNKRRSRQGPSLHCHSVPVNSMKSTRLFVPLPGLHHSREACTQNLSARRRCHRPSRMSTRRRVLRHEHHRLQRGRAVGQALAPRRGPPSSSPWRIGWLGGSRGGERAKGRTNLSGGAFRLSVSRGAVGGQRFSSPSSPRTVTGVETQCAAEHVCCVMAFRCGWK